MGILGDVVRGSREEGRGRSKDRGGGMERGGMEEGCGMGEETRGGSGEKTE